MGPGRGAEAGRGPWETVLITKKTSLYPHPPPGSEASLEAPPKAGRGGVQGDVAENQNKSPGPSPSRPQDWHPSWIPGTKKRFTVWPGRSIPKPLCFAYFLL